MKRVGNEIAAAERWGEVADHYAATIEDAYHQHRIEVIKALLPDLAGARVVDFGCGEGVFAEIAFKCGADSVVGIDIEPTLLERARRREPRAEYLAGGVERLGDIADGGADCLIAANVLAYFTDIEDAGFYADAARVLRTGGHLVVTHSNALFDLFTFNAYTVAFCREHFGVDPSGLLVHHDKPNRMSFNIRENPLAYPAKLAGVDFTVERMEFINRHAQPPLLSGDDPDDMARERPDTLAVDEAERWKLIFQCSMFGVRAVRV